MAPDREEFDPEAPSEREIGREMVDQSTGLGSVAAHLYRGEVDRATAWRTRLDSTTNWAVTVIAAIIAYSFSRSDVSHGIVLTAMLIGAVFLFVEARRFCRYDIWRSRVRTLQENLFANALDPSGGVEQVDWRRQLSEDYRRPDQRMPLRVALAHRLRRVYLPLMVALLLVWLFRLSGETESLLRAAALPGAPGWAVVGVVAASYAGLVALAVWPNPDAMTETGGAVDRGDLDDVDDGE